jgi:mono/diheme cytochrome c family protein
MRRSILADLAIALAILAGTSGLANLVHAQTGAPAAATNDLQRSLKIYNYNVAATSGAQRGEVIYYYKCWVCHNDYTIAAGSPAPTLKDLFKRAQLRTGDPVNDTSVANQIRNGSAQMPAFGTFLKDNDIADLLAYLHDKCCYEETNPPKNPWYRATAANSPQMPLRGNLWGGPKGAVHSTRGDALEGIMVQLVASNAVRTTVYSDQDGQYEFPKLPAGSYTLRIARPLQFLPYQRDAVKIDGATALDDIVLEPRYATDFLPPAPDILPQLTGSEWLWNLPGTAEEKYTFIRNCGNGCHSFQQILRNQLDERSWGLMVFRMMHHAGSPLINRAAARGNREQEERIVKWLARVRAPGEELPLLRVYPRPHGAASSSRRMTCRAIRRAISGIRATARRTWACSIRAPAS